MTSTTLVVHRGTAPVPAPAAIRGEAFARMINLSGRRRFTSQRLVLYTVLAAQGVSGALSTAREALQQFCQAHDTLVRARDGLPGLFSAALHDAYMGPPQGHAKVRAFIDLAERCMLAVESGWKRQLPVLLEQLVADTTPLLAVLNHMTAVYEQEARAHSQAMERQLRNAMGEIHSVSKQAQVVAMNARIVAARAGDVGREFAVVANELIAITSNIDTILDGAMREAA
ncbi:MAG: methyl-accepting chemotaxis protein [Rhodoferax sp.]